MLSSVEELNSDCVPEPLAPASRTYVVQPLVTDDDELQARITGATESGVILERDGVTREYRYADLGPGRVQVEFSHLDEEMGEEDMGGH